MKQTNIKKLLIHIISILALMLISPIISFSQDGDRNLNDEVSSGEEKDIVELTPFEISATGDRGYVSKHTLGGTRINVELENMAGSVVVLNQELFEDLNTNELDETLRFASGVARTSSIDNNQVVVRGVATSEGLNFRDGIPEWIDGNGYSAIDPIGLERVEVIKGPAGTLYGAHPVGGLINRISKAPLSEQNTTVAFEVGSNSWLRGEVDVTGPVGKNKKLLYRVMAAYQDAETQQGTQNDRNTFISHFTYQASENTKGWFRMEYLDFSSGKPTGPWFTDTEGILVDPDLVPAKTFVGDPNYNLRGIYRWIFEVGYSHAFSVFDSDWSVRFVGRHIDMDSINDTAQSRRPIYEGPGGDPLTFEDDSYRHVGNTSFAEAEALGWTGVFLANADLANKQSNEHEVSGFAIDLTGEFKLGPSSHKMISYFQGTHFTHYRKVNKRYTWDPGLQNILNINTSFPEDYTNETTQGADGRIDIADNFSWGIQDNVRFLDERLIIVGGARYDWEEGRQENYRTGTADPSEIEKEWVFKYGIIGKPVKGVALFYNHSETFTPETGSNQLGVPFENLEGVQDEFGFKLDLLGGRVVATASYFDIALKNLKGLLVLPDDTQITVQTGETSDKGFEADLALIPTDNITFLLGIQSITAVDEDGDRQRGVPQGVTYTMVGKYAFREGALAGLNLGMAFEHMTERAGDTNDTFTLPGFNTTDAWVSYKWNERWRLQLNVTNIFDNDYALSANARFQVFPGLKRSLKFRVQYSF